MVPICLKVWNPWPMEYMMSFGAIEGNLATFLFMPMVVYNFVVMEPETIRAGETDAQFSARIQQQTADELGTGVTNFNFRHKEHMMEAVNGKLDERYWKSDDAGQEAWDLRMEMANRGGLVGMYKPEKRTMFETKKLLSKRRMLAKKYKQLKKERKKSGKAKVVPA